MQNIFVMQIVSGKLKDILDIRWWSEKDFLNLTVDKKNFGFKDFKQKFDVGVDEMSWDDKLEDTEYEKLLNSGTTINEEYEMKLNDYLKKQQEYRNSVKITVLDLIKNTDLDVIKNGKVDKYSFANMSFVIFPIKAIYLATFSDLVSVTGASSLKYRIKYLWSALTSSSIWLSLSLVAKTSSICDLDCS